MSNALVKKSDGGGSWVRAAIPGVTSFFIPGSGQVINGQAEKGIGVFAVWGGAAAVAWLGLPLITPIAAGAAGLMALYAAADGAIHGYRKK